MKAIIEYLDDLKEKNGSDYATAKKLNISKEAVSQIRKRGTVADETALKMADLLGIDRNEVVIAATIARSDGEVRKTWENISKLSGVAASMLVACILTGNDANAAEDSNVHPVSHNIHYAKYILRKIKSGIVIALNNLLSLRSQIHDTLLPRSYHFF